MQFYVSVWVEVGRLVCVCGPINVCVCVSGILCVCVGGGVFATLWEPFSRKRQLPASWGPNVHHT